MEDTYTAPVGADLNDMAIWDEEVVYDPTAELNQTNLPPDDRKHLVVWTLGRDGIGVPKRTQSGAFFTTHLQGKIVAPGEAYDGMVIFDRPTSIVFKSGTGKLQAWLKSVGQPAPGRCSLGELKARVTAALAGSAQGRVRGQWVASVQDGEETNPTTGKTYKKYKDVAKGMKSGAFAQRPDGTFNPSIEHDGVTVTAQFTVRDYLEV
jgi:hypothetical protein